MAFMGRHSWRQECKVHDMVIPDLNNDSYLHHVMGNLQTKSCLFNSYLLIIYLMFYDHLSSHSPLTLG